jgi:hypothetical protein
MAKKSAPRSKTHDPAPDRQAFEAAYEAATECVNCSAALIMFLNMPAGILVPNPEGTAPTQRRIIDETNEVHPRGARSERDFALEDLRQLLQNKRSHDDAISAVGPELMDTRAKRGPLRVPPLIADTAHGAALQYRDRILQEMRTALTLSCVIDKRQYRNPSALPEVAEVAENYEAVRRRFLQLDPGVWPDVDVLLVEIRWEARKATRRFRAPSSEHQRATGVSPKLGKKILPERRTRPLTMVEAAKLMGLAKKRGEKEAVKCLRAAIKNGVIACETLTRQQHVFDKNEFPRDVWQELAPTGPKSP